MAQNQTNVSSRDHNQKIRSAIDMLLSSDSVKVSEPEVKLTVCSSELDVVINKQGGICTKCNVMFKSRTSLITHIEKCLGSSNIFGLGLTDTDTIIDLINNDKGNNKGSGVKLNIIGQNNEKIDKIGQNNNERIDKNEQIEQRKEKKDQNRVVQLRIFKPPSPKLIIVTN